jgi:hypothetical protein
MRDGFHDGFYVLSNGEVEELVVRCWEAFRR